MSKSSPRSDHPCLEIGLTGGIGSGKSLVARFWKLLGIPVFDADTEARNILSENEQVRRALIELLGSEAYRQNEEPNRAYIASQIFGNEALRQKVNAIVHPAVGEAYAKWRLEQASRSPYTIKEAAILLETGQAQEFDFIVLVTAPLHLRSSRVVESRGMSPSDFQKRAEAQWTDEEKRRYSHYEIVNDEREAIIPQVMGIHGEMLAVIQGG